MRRYTDAQMHRRTEAQMYRKQQSTLRIGTTRTIQPRRATRLHLPSGQVVFLVEPSEVGRALRGNKVGVRTRTAVLQRAAYTQGGWDGCKGEDLKMSNRGVQGDTTSTAAEKEVH